MAFERSIFKYPIQVTDTQVIEMPANARILCVQMQRGVPCLWAMVHVGTRVEQRVIRIVGTGHSTEGVHLMTRYIGTFQMEDACLVWHVFEEGA